MHEFLFSQSWTPPRFTVLGLPLEPFTIGHELILWNKLNPAVTYNLAGFKELPMEEKGRALAEAVQICYNDKDAKAKKLFDDSKKWIKTAAELDLDKEIEAFFAYREACGQDFPVMKMPRTQGVPFHYFGAPDVARLINYVVEKHSLLITAHFNGTPLDFPLGLARTLYSTHLETEGAIWVKNQQDMEREAPRKPGTPPPGLNEKVLTGEAAEKAFNDAVAMAEKGAK